MNSMTGYFAVQKSLDTCSASVEIRTVNNRYLETNIRMPHYLMPYESEIKRVLQAAFSRGKLDLYIDIREREKAVELAVNESLAGQYQQMYFRLADLTGADRKMPLSLLFSAAGVIEQFEVTSADAVWAIVKPLIDEAVAGLAGIRNTEGRETAKDVAATLKKMQADAAVIGELAANLLPDMRAELEKRLERMVNREIDERMILSEAGILASRADVHEELARFASHCALFEEQMQSAEPVGKTLDFICQEMNREINTIGSKQSDYTISERVIMLKTHLEKIREQVRNIE